MPQSQPNTRSIESVYAIPPHGTPRTSAGAITYIASVEPPTHRGPFAPYEVGVRYTNGDEVRGQFKDKPTALAFLRGIR